MTSTAVRTLPSTADSTYVIDLVDHLADGVPAIVAAEIYDHPAATDTRGTWAVGTREQVDAYLDAHGFESYEIIYSAGRDPEEIADDVPSRMPINGSTALLRRYSSPALRGDNVAGWLVDQANFADNSSHLGQLWMDSVGRFTLYDIRKDRVAVGFDLEAVLGHVLPLPKPEPVTVRLVVEVTVDPEGYVSESGCTVPEIAADMRTTVDEAMHELPGNPRVSVRLW